MKTEIQNEVLLLLFIFKRLKKEKEEKEEGEYLPIVSIEKMFNSLDL